MTALPSPRGDVAVLVPAAGIGARLGPGIPKALRQLSDTPLLVHCVRRLLEAPSVGTVVIAAPPSEVDDVAAMVGARAAMGRSVIVVPGGATRHESVGAALGATPTGFDIILVHDAARALAPASLVESVAAAVRGGYDAVTPVLPVVDTIKEVSDDGAVVGTVDRDVLRRVQTPQGFRRQVLLAAHAAAVDPATDDAGLVEKLGVTVYTVPGSEFALKITSRLDLEIAEALLRAEGRQ